MGCFPDPVIIDEEGYGVFGTRGMDVSVWVREAGFEDVRIVPRPESGAIIAQCMPGAEAYVASATIEGRKPGGAACCAPACCA